MSNNIPDDLYFASVKTAPTVYNYEMIRYYYAVVCGIGNGSNRAGAYDRWPSIMYICTLFHLNKTSVSECTFFLYGCFVEITG